MKAGRVWAWLGTGYMLSERPSPVLRSRVFVAWTWTAGQVAWQRDEVVAPNDIPATPTKSL